MSDALHLALDVVVAEAFERLGYLFANLDMDPHERAPVPTCATVVRFTGPSNGAVVVRGDATLLATLAMNMLGSDEPPEPALQLDALGEIANVICGNLLPVAICPKAVFRLAAPAPVEAVGEPTGRERVSLRMAFDAGTAEITLLEDTV